MPLNQLGRIDQFNWPTVGLHDVEDKQSERKLPQRTPLLPSLPNFQWKWKYMLRIPPKIAIHSKDGSRFIYYNRGLWQMPLKVH
jgi:hypothetical protein